MAGIILMGLFGPFSRGGTSKSRSLSAGRASASCIRWRILHSPTGWEYSIGCYMGIDLLGWELKFSGLMISISVSSQRSLRTSGEVSTSLAVISFTTDSVLVLYLTVFAVSSKFVKKMGKICHALRECKRDCISRPGLRK